ncbi:MULTISPECIES: GNAT family N-acetyltransferase [unclassified Acinetobacter]|uniref:GNAT family N-acetyltransferase n=1 Tax=unclassified Acinetobacter TaxID=196816 RepID=UPI0029344E1F|nr:MULTISPECIES: GNAT family N-acetyltransferase [unclassified Acinetobacter]WOE30630.1 GNAT family N-acetyltransferase [Acinetobacter sp. SAAs470]WOE38822.1 GNAT family N-acetyltransferase [Acinetobacter sp. SAAs474]
MLETERLILRQWQVQDYLPFINMGLDPEVMQYFPDLLTREESLQFIDTVKDIIDQNQWGFWAVVLKQTGEFIGFIGLHHQPEQFEFSPCVEIGWRLARQYWGNGYATEGAKAAIVYAFNQLNLNKIVSFTAEINLPSQSVMKRIGMSKVGEFNHPKLSSGHDLEKHVLYQIVNPRLISSV